jgi:hypothetical protein
VNKRQKIIVIPLGFEDARDQHKRRIASIIQPTVRKPFRMRAAERDIVRSVVCLIAGVWLIVLAIMELSK